MRKLNFLLTIIAFVCFSNLTYAAALPERWIKIWGTEFQDFYVDSQSITRKDDMIVCWNLTIPLNDEKSQLSWTKMTSNAVKYDNLPIRADEIKMVSANVCFNIETREVAIEQMFYMRSINDSYPIPIKHQLKWISVRPDSVNEKLLFAAQEILAEKK